tara:strand:- start:23760 stop:24329 length:570 start_codon:yes stop_codon:yes gene_type:complete
LFSDIELKLTMDFIFWIIAIPMIISSLMVVLSTNLFRSALFLIFSFITVALIFILLRAEFLAIIEILVYVGAISVLIIFAILMTKNIDTGSPSNSFNKSSIIFSILIFVVLFFVFSVTEWNTIENIDSTNSISPSNLENIKDIYSNSIPYLAKLLLTDFMLAFELASVLLMAALIGGLYLIKGDDSDNE